MATNKVTAAFVDGHDRRADLQAQAREVEAKLAEIDAETAAAAAASRRRQAEAVRNWSEQQVGRVREIFGPVEEYRAQALAALRRFDVAAAQSYWLRARIEMQAAPTEWGIVKDLFEQHHPGQRAMPGRDYTGNHPGTRGETFDEFMQRAVVKMGREAEDARYTATQAAIAEVTGAADAGEIIAGARPTGVFQRMRWNHEGHADAALVPHPGRFRLGNVVFAADQGGTIRVYSEDEAKLLRAYAERADTLLVEVGPDGSPVEVVPDEYRVITEATG